MNLRSKIGRFGLVVRVGGRGGGVGFGFGGRSAVAQPNAPDPCALLPPCLSGVGVQIRAQGIQPRVE